MNSESQIITTIMFHEENTGFCEKKVFLFKKLIIIEFVHNSIKNHTEICLTRSNNFI